mgnify:CR=1 FL=1
MDKKDIYDRLRKALAEEFETDENRLDESSILADVLEIDSLDVVDLVVLVQENFGVKLSKKNIDKNTTLDSLCQSIFALTETTEQK